MQSLEASRNYKNSFVCAAKIFKHEGVLTFWSGAVPRLARLVLSGGIVFTMCGFLCSLFNKLLQLTRWQVRKNNGVTRSGGSAAQVHLGMLDGRKCLSLRNRVMVVMKMCIYNTWYLLWCTDIEGILPTAFTCLVTIPQPPSLPPHDPPSKSGRFP